MKLRRLGVDDWRSFREVRLAALAESPGNYFASLTEAEALPDSWWRDLLDQERIALFGLFDDDTPVGITGVFVDRDDPSGRTAAFGMTWIAPSHRGRGLSALYYRERIAWARTAEFARVEVSHRDDNLASGRAMRAAGFHQIGRRSRQWPDGVVADDLVYALDLA